MSLTIISAKNPQATSANNASIHLTVKFAEIPEEIEFTAMPTDSEVHGIELYKRAISGEFGDIKEFVPPPQPKSTGVKAA